MLPIATYPGIFITVEGIEGVGKSTAVTYLKNYLTEAGQPVTVTREPGGTVLAERIRSLLLDATSPEPMEPITELLLMFASRAQHVAQLILPALQAGQWILSDRFVDASFAYQGYGRGMNLTQLNQLAAWTIGSLQPDLTILLDAPYTISFARTQQRGSNQDRIEQENRDFFARVQAGYLARAAAEPQRFRVIDASASLKTVQQALRQALQPLLTRKSDTTCGHNKP